MSFVVICKQILSIYITHVNTEVLIISIKHCVSLLFSFQSFGYIFIHLV